MFVDSEVACNCPLWTADAFGGLIELGCHIEIEYLGFASVNPVENNQQIDFQISKVKVDIDAVEANKEVCERLFLFGWDILQKRRCNSLPGRERCQYRQVEESLGIDVTNVDTTFMCENDFVALLFRSNTNMLEG